MTKHESYQKELRERAEEFIDKNPSAIKEVPPADVKELIEELHIHQIELEMQNEELRRSQLELEAARDKYSDLYDFAPVGYFRLSDKGMILEANLTGAGMLGMERGLLVGTPLSKFIKRDDQDEYYLHQRQLLEEKTQPTCELRLTKKGGTEFYAQMESMLIKDPDDNSNRIRTVLIDVSERKQLEALLEKKTHDLRERMKQLTCLYQISHIREKQGISLEDLLQEVNDILPLSWQYPETACSRIVYDGKEYVTKNFKETKWKQAADLIVHEKPAGYVEICYLEERPASHEGPFHQEERNLIEAIAERLGKVIEHTKAEKALRIERDNLNNILSTMKDGVYIADNEYNVEFLSPPLEEEFGPLEGKKCYEYFHNRKKSCPWCKSQEVFAGKTVRWEWYSPRNQKTYDLVDTPLKNPDGSISKLEIFHDITGRKDAIKELQTAHDLLEEKVDERTFELRNLSSKILNTLEEERRRVAMELHDGIGQSMSAIKFKVETSLKEMDQEKSVKAIKSLAPVVSIVKQGVEEIRRISMNLRPSILDDLGVLATISWFCRETKKIYSGIQIQKQIHINENSVPDSLKIVIYRILQEAFHNITKHSQADQISLSLTRENNRIDLTINDNGVGFEVGDAFAGKRHMDGVGLASMKERTSLSGGHFIIESQIGAGTTLRASWPLSQRIT